MDEDIAELLSSTPEQQRTLPPQPSRAQMVEAFEKAHEAYDLLDSLSVFGDDPEPVARKYIERNMVKTQAQAIDAVQREQMEKPLTRTQVFMPGPDLTHHSVTAEIEDYTADLRNQAMERRKREQAKAMAEMFKSFGATFEDVARAASQVISVFTDAFDAISTAMQPILDLLDQQEDFPVKPVCPSHGRTLIGGSCRSCQRGMMGQTRYTGR